MARTWLLLAATLTIAISSPVAAFSRRDVDICETHEYVAWDGLSFEVWCGVDAPLADQPDQPIFANDLGGCMETCSQAHVNGCYGVAFSESTHHCWLKSYQMTTDSNDTVPNSKISVGMVSDRSQLRKLPGACEYDDGATPRTNDGEVFKIHCNQDIPGHNYDAQNIDEARWPWRTDTLEDCLLHCEEAITLCEGVTWHPDSEFGWPNCFPKQNVTSSNLVPAKDNTVHAAIPQLPKLPQGCDDGEVTTTHLDQNFLISCDQDQIGNDIWPPQYAATLEDCTMACASYPDGKCWGVMWDHSLKNGFRNCYFKEQAGRSQPWQGRLIAQKTDQKATIFDGSATLNTTDSSDPKAAVSHADPDSDSASSSKVWIAGAVIGPVVAIALGIVGFLLWRRRKRSNDQRSESASHLPESYGPSSFSSTSPYPSPNPAPYAPVLPKQNVIYEKDTSNIPPILKSDDAAMPFYGRPAATPSELEGSPKPRRF